MVLEIEVLFLPIDQAKLQENDLYSFYQNVFYEHRICRKRKNKELYVSLPMNKQKPLK